MNINKYRKKLIWEKRKNKGILSIKDVLKILEEAVKEETKTTAKYLHGHYTKTNAITGQDLRGVK